MMTSWAEEDCKAVREGDAQGESEPVLEGAADGVG
jgi:hypothetical protein